MAATDAHAITAQCAGVGSKQTKTGPRGSERSGLESADGEARPVVAIAVGVSQPGFVVGYKMRR